MQNVLLHELPAWVFRQDLLDKHREVCTKHGAQRLSFPEDTTVKFKSIAKQQRVPFAYTRTLNAAP